MSYMGPAMNWEYQVLRCEDIVLMETLNDAGNRAWELVSISKEERGYLAVLKRPVGMYLAAVADDMKITGSK